MTRIFFLLLTLLMIDLVTCLVPEVNNNGTRCLGDWNNRCRVPSDCCSQQCWRGECNWEFGVCIPGGGGGTPGGGGGGTPGTTSSGKTTRYWDCCKPSCSWAGKAPVTQPVATCAADGITVLGVNEQSGCGNGPAFTCNNNQPWVINDGLSYGFAAAHLTGQSESDWCCSCQELTFTSGPIIGKRFIVQVTNTGGDLGENHFDLQIPGGGVGIFNGCTRQWNAPTDGWGDRYGGVHSDGECSRLPAQLQAGCRWRFGWFQNADNPTMTFRKVDCPQELTDRSRCVRTQ